MDTFISVNDAVKETGKSVSSVRRAIKKIPPESIKVEGKKFFYDRGLLYRELDVVIQPESVTNEPEKELTDSEKPLNESTDSLLLEAYRSQIQMQAEQLRAKDEQLRVKDDQIAQFLERQHETNILLNQRQLPVTPEPVADEKKKDSPWVAWLLITILVGMLGLATYFSWPG